MSEDDNWCPDEDEWTPPTEVELKVIAARRERSDKISKLMGDYLLKGYRMLASNCPHCTTVELQDKRGVKYCVACQEMSTDIETADLLGNLRVIPEEEIDLTKPRTDYLEWSEYFMAVSFLSAMRSKDPATQVGACIVNSEKRIVGIGYNGMPRGCEDDKMPWGKTSDNELDNKYLYVCHAEMNAILNKNSASVAGCTIYVALFPCNECAKIIIQSGIRNVIYFSDKHKDKTNTVASKKLLGMAGVNFTQFRPKMKRIVIEFDSVEPHLSEDLLELTPVTED